MSWIDKLFGDGNGDLEAPEDPLRGMTGPTDVADALGAPVSVIYKHSPVCGISGWAQVEVRQFAHAHPDIPVYFLDVVRHRAVAEEVERRLAVRHESPQVIVVRGGFAAWHASHGRVSDAALREALSTTSPPSAPPKTT